MPNSDTTETRFNSLMMGSLNPSDIIAELPFGWACLQHLSLLDVEGEDATDFLQGQFTNDISNLDLGGMQLTSYCNPKGRMVGIYWLTRTASGYGLIVPSALSSNLIKRLTLYRMRAKVTVSLNQNVALLGLVGNDALFDAKGLTINDSLSIAIVPGTPDGPAEGTLEELSMTRRIHSDTWRSITILSAIPQVYAETTELFIPQQVNLDLLNGVSFTKGCYPGQEIVARIRYLGKIKQRMIAARIIASDANTMPTIVAGSPVFSKEREAQKVGTVVDTVKIDSTIILTAMIPSSHIDTGELFVGVPGENQLQRFEPAYPITIEKA